MTRRPPKQRVVRAHRGARCGFCYWALYDGEWCQNKDCEWSGKEPPEKVNLTNAEAATLIEAMRPNCKLSEAADAGAPTAEDETPPLSLERVVRPSGSTTYRQSENSCRFILRKPLAHGKV
jgi:hypothetical protein